MLKKIIAASLILLPFASDANNCDDIDTAAVTINIQNNTDEPLPIDNFIKVDTCDDKNGKNYNNAPFFSFSTNTIPPNSSASIKGTVYTDVVLGFNIGPYILTMQEGGRGKSPNQVDFKGAIQGTLNQSGNSYQIANTAVKDSGVKKTFYWNVFSPQNADSSIYASSQQVSYPGSMPLCNLAFCQNLSVKCDLKEGGYNSDYYYVCDATNNILVNTLPQLPLSQPL